MIVGAGVAGCTAALALQAQFLQSGARIILIDKGARPEARIGECLAASARRVLSSLDLLNEFEQSAHLDALWTVSHWGREQAQISDPLRNPDGYPKLLDRAAFKAWLRCKAEQRGVKCMWPSMVNQIKRDGELWHVESADGVRLVAP